MYLNAGFLNTTTKRLQSILSTMSAEDSKLANCKMSSDNQMKNRFHNYWHGADYSFNGSY